MSAELHAIRDLSMDQSHHPAELCAVAAQLRIIVHSLIAWSWQAGMSIPRVPASDHLVIHLERGALGAEIGQDFFCVAAGERLWIPKGSMRSLSATEDSLFIASHLDVIVQPGIQFHPHTVSPCYKADLTHLKNLLRHSSPGQQEYLTLCAHYFQQQINTDLLSGRSIVDNRDQGDPRIAQALNLLEQDPGLSAEQCARLVELGTTRFRQRFIACCGISPGKYITQLRVRKAAELLRSSDASIASISQACGYENPNYLYRAFKRIHHCTPQHYRLGQRQEL